jgi:sialidase-1
MKSLFTLLITLALTAKAAEPEQTDLFTPNQDGYKSYRIPALLVTRKGSLLAFCEGRVNGKGDSGDIDLLCKRSTDAGRTFAKTQVVWDDARNTCGNPAPVQDRDTGTIFLLMTHNPGDEKEKEITSGAAKQGRTVWVTQSDDDGLTWSKPRDITSTTKKPDWTWYATGPGAALQTRAGRLFIPCDFKTAKDEGFSHILYSDDHGKTWQLGGVAGPATNESRVIELADGKLLLNMRVYKGKKEDGRAISTSADGGITWSPVTQDATLQEPVCQGALIPVPELGPSAFLFSNPASTKRENLTVRLTRDDCKTWPHARSLHKGPSGYSDLAVLPDQSILCLYERGEKNYSEKITLARFTLDWLKE